jgi:hypothetical protein
MPMVLFRIYYHSHHHRSRTSLGPSRPLRPWRGCERYSASWRGDGHRGHGADESFARPPGAGASTAGASAQGRARCGPTGCSAAWRQHDRPRPRQGRAGPSVPVARLAGADLGGSDQARGARWGLAAEAAPTAVARRPLAMAARASVSPGVPPRARPAHGCNSPAIGSARRPSTPASCGLPARVPSPGATRTRPDLLGMATAQGLAPRDRGGGWATALTAAAKQHGAARVSASPFGRAGSGRLVGRLAWPVGRLFWLAPGPSRFGGWPRGPPRPRGWPRGPPRPGGAWAATMWPNWSLDGLFIIFCSFTFLNTAFFVILHQCYESIFKLLDPLMLYVILHICLFLL